LLINHFLHHRLRLSFSVDAYCFKSLLSLGRSLARVADRRNPNIAAVALANRNARIVWALLAHGRDFQTGYRLGITVAAWRPILTLDP
jgi:hypothetical protein